MKCIKKLKATISNGKITITGDIAEEYYGFPAQQVSVSAVSKDNLGWSRQAQISQEAFFVKRLGSIVAIPIEEWLPVAIQLEPKLTWPPLFSKQPTDTSLMIEVNSEIEPSLKWQVSDDGKTWADAESVASPVSGKFYRCVASTVAGETISEEIKFK